jgi:hypothetical protein
MDISYSCSGSALGLELGLIVGSVLGLELGSVLGLIVGLFFSRLRMARACFSVHE